MAQPLTEANLKAMNRHPPSMPASKHAGGHLISVGPRPVPRIKTEAPLPTSAATAQSGIRTVTAYTPSQTQSLANSGHAPTNQDHVRDSWGYDYLETE